jgi:polysaccharide deacetylase family protein (PEP-CTERM system associated)
MQLPLLQRSWRNAFTMHGRRALRNVFSVDLEDWYCSRTLEGIIPRSRWLECESRVVHGTQRLLELLDRYRIEATFFVLGFVAEREPELVRTIADAGHEIATHGYFHQHLAEITPDDFARDLDRALDVTTRVTGEPVYGYRAPNFSIIESTAGWALPILKSRGLRYDSSVFPMKGHPEYGIAGAPLDRFIHANDLVEIPISCVELGSMRLPATGGGYIRQFPWPVTRQLFHRCNRQGRPVIFYIHPWEIDPDPPRLPLPLVRRLRHYRNITATFDRIERMVAEFPFTSVRRMLDDREL